MYGILPIVKWYFACLYLHDISIFREPLDYIRTVVELQSRAGVWSTRRNASSSSTVSIIWATSWSLTDKVYWRKQPTSLVDYKTLWICLNSSRFSVSATCLDGLIWDSHKYPSYWISRWNRTSHPTLDLWTWEKMRHLKHYNINCCHHKY